MATVLSRSGAKALVQARLAALGHAPDFMTHEALEALRARAGHEEGMLGAALSAVLFVVATEDAPRIESRHVEQAVPEGEAPRPAAPGGWRGVQIASAGLGGAAAGALLALWVVHRPAHVMGPVVVVEPPVVVALAPKRLAPVVVPESPLVDLPVAPPLRVTLLVPAGDTESARRFVAVAARLRDAGIGGVQVESFNDAKKDVRALRNHVVYYFRQDALLAENLVNALDSAEDSSHIRNSWVPILVPAVAGSTSHPPGSIDVFAP
jgi:hypothetical protein